MNDIDEKIRKIFSEEQTPPGRYDYKIKNTLNDIKTKKKSNLKFLKVCISSVCCSIILLTGVVFAKDIEKYIKKVFVNSTEAIDLAVENDYVQEIDNSYIYDKNIGVKVNNLFYDKVYMNISFNFKLQQNNVKSVSLNDFNITSDNNKIIYRSNLEYTENFEEIPIYNYFNGLNESIKLSDNEFMTSIMIGLKEHDVFNQIFLKISKLRINYEDGTNEIIDGNWNLEIKIKDDMKKSLNVKYEANKKIEYLESCTATLNPSVMIIELKLSTPVNEQNFIEYWNQLVQNKDNELYIKINNKKISHTSFNFDVNNNLIYLEYDNIGFFSDKIQSITLVSEIYNKTIVLEQIHN